MAKKKVCLCFPNTYLKVVLYTGLCDLSSFWPGNLIACERQSSTKGNEIKIKEYSSVICLVKDFNLNLPHQEDSITHSYKILFLDI